MTQAELARKTGIRAATINEIYHEIAERINIDHIDLICEALGCDLNELIEYVPNKQKRIGTDMILSNKRKPKKKV